MLRLETSPTLDHAPLSTFQMADLGDKFHLPSLGNLESATREVAKPIDFAPNLKEAITRGQQTGKPVVVIFEEDNCGWCKRFDSELGKPAATALACDAIFVKVSPSKDASAQALANSLGVDSYPTISVLNVSGSGINERTRMVGYLSADDFATRFREHGQTQMA